MGISIFGHNVGNMWDTLKNYNFMGCLLVECNSPVNPTDCPTTDVTLSNAELSNLSIHLHFVNESCMYNHGRATEQFINDTFNKLNSFCTFCQHASPSRNTIHSAISVCKSKDTKCDYVDTANKPEDICIIVQDLAFCIVEISCSHLKRSCRYLIETSSNKYQEVQESINFAQSTEASSIPLYLIKTGYDDLSVPCGNTENKFVIVFEAGKNPICAEKKTSNYSFPESSGKSFSLLPCQGNFQQKPKEGQRPQYIPPTQLSLM